MFELLHKEFPNTKKLSVYDKYRMLDSWNGYIPKKGKKLGYYSYIPMNPSFLRSMKKDLSILLKGKLKTFLDIGCGKGNMLFQAAEIGLQPTGLEYNKELVRLANVIIQTYQLDTNIEIIHKDYFNWKPDKEYGLIYWWSPPSSSALYTKFLEKILSDFPTGQLIITPDFLGRFKSKTIKKSFKRLESPTKGYQYNYCIHEVV